MRQLMCFLMVGLAFIVLQVSTVEAEEDCASLPTPDEVAACWDAAGHGGDTGHHDGEPHDPPMCGDVPCPPPGEDDHAGEPHDPPMCAGPLDTMIPCPPPGEDDHAGEPHDPAMGDPAMGDPAMGDPAMGDPAMGDPAMGDPPMCAGPLDTMIPCPPPGEHHEGDHPDCPEGTTCDGPDGHHPEGEHHDGPPDCAEIPDDAGRELCEKTTAEGRPPTADECAQMPTEEGRADCMEHAAGGEHHDETPPAP